jgi:hypothetical protein
VTISQVADAYRTPSCVLLLATARDAGADWEGRTDQRAALARCGRLGAGAAGFEVEQLDRAQHDLLTEARELLPDSGLRASVTARLSVAGAVVIPERRHLELAEEAVRAAPACGDRASPAYALSALCDARVGPDHCAKRRRWAEEIIEIASDLRELTLELLGRRLRVVALCEQGELAAVDDEVRAFAAGPPAQPASLPLILASAPAFAPEVRAIRELV